MWHLSVLKSAGGVWVSDNRFAWTGRGFERRANVRKDPGRPGCRSSNAERDERIVHGRDGIDRQSNKAMRKRRYKREGVMS